MLDFQISIDEITYTNESSYDIIYELNFFQLTINLWILVNSAVDILEDWHIPKAVFYKYPARNECSFENMNNCRLGLSGVKKNDGTLLTECSYLDKISHVRRPITALTSVSCLSCNNTIKTELNLCPKHPSVTGNDKCTSFK